MLPGALSPDLGKQERTPTRQTTAGIPSPQQGHGAGACCWSGDWCTADAALNSKLLIALGILAAYLLVTTKLLPKEVEQPSHFLLRLNSQGDPPWSRIKRFKSSLGAL